ncbi:zinc finger protein Xfin-like [Venturia canescens]|uniref:zinc finger protein Xfin-like n=1 Tax=Venturia canescens TaxID=32260 RepID=UPI001C9BED50|nr:zinc finger protein Xfin-like [Venturia canescens]XP_043272799.1 zinc finger protein Xfin-like [Venturia canescens]
MNDIVDVRNVGNVCRLCLSSKKPKSSVFADQAIAAVSLASKIQTCLSIEILTSDKLSTSICSDCLRRVNKWHSYKEYCLRSQQKLKQCLVQLAEGAGNIKVEPPDVDEAMEVGETVPLSSDEETEDVNDVSDGLDNNETPRRATSIKRELIEGDENRTVAGEFARSSELLLNPMAVASHREERSSDADSTEKTNSLGLESKKGMKRKVRRGPLTHYRGLRRYKQRCAHCQIYLHSKYSYSKHMERFHSGKEIVSKGLRVRKLIKRQGEESSLAEQNSIIEEEEGMETEMEVEDVEDELISLEKDAPLTPVQQNIISQLKTFSCYTCGVSFGDRRSTLNHIRQHMPDLRPYTCIACLTEFADRSVYKLHCGASFQCAMKIALVVPEHGTEKYFTCNMCLRSLVNRKELLSHLSRHSDRQYEQMMGGPFRPPPRLEPVSSVTTPQFVSAPSNSKNPKRKDAAMKGDRKLPAPYNHGDPAHNHPCTYCGMIYKHKQNLSRHIILCKNLPAECRVCYRCINCGLTFLAFNKFQNHVSQAHHKKNHIVCYRCDAKVKPSDFVSHYREHYGNGDDQWTEVPPDHVRDELVVVSPPRYSKANERSNPRLSIKSDPGGNFECDSCGKVFASVPNLKRHVRAVHELHGRFNCFTCAKTFAHEEEWTEHVELEHKRAAERVENCPECSSVFESPQELILHRRDVHGLEGEDHLACYICGKTFASETSLKIHRGHHFRVNSRLSIGNDGAREGEKTLATVGTTTTTIIGGKNVSPVRNSDQARSVTSPRARKSFPNGSPLVGRVERGALQCQVCDDRFNDVTDLRNHLWEVHCARSKPEKQFIRDKLQCELCTNVLPDEESLASHIKWHENNPILSNGGTAKREQAPAQCDLCGKFYSSIANLRKHKKRHKAAPSVGGGVSRGRKRWSFGEGFTCEVCRKIFASRSIMDKHKLVAHPTSKKGGSSSKTSTSDRRASNPVDHYVKPTTLVSPPKRNSNVFPEDRKQSIVCNLCGKTMADIRVLVKHRQVVHKITNDTDFGLDPNHLSSPQVACTSCPKKFTNLSNMRQHYTKVHGASAANRATRFSCSLDGCNFTFETLAAKRNHEKSHANVVYTCGLCPRQSLSPSLMAAHMLTAHRANRASSNDKMTLCKKIHIDKYEVRGANGRKCPICEITYPNYKALKIHYLKIHEDEA